jgi:hypothetical protein
VLSIQRYGIWVEMDLIDLPAVQPPTLRTLTARNAVLAAIGRVFFFRAKFRSSSVASNWIPRASMRDERSSVFGCSSRNLRDSTPEV